MENSIINFPKETEIEIEGNDGTSKVCVFNEDGEMKEIKGKLSEKGYDKGISNFSELKEYISKNRDNIKSVSAKNGSYNKKIGLADFIKRELNTTNYNSNPEKLGEDLILSLLKPIKVLSNFFAQQSFTEGKKESFNTGKDLVEKGKELVIKIDNESFIFKGYNENFSKIIVKNERDKKETLYELSNDKNFVISNPPERTFTSVELDLLAKGKTLVVSNHNPPFKIKQENGQNRYTILSQTDFIKNLSQKINQSRDQKEKNKIKI